MREFFPMFLHALSLCASLTAGPNSPTLGDKSFQGCLDWYLPYSKFSSLSSASNASWRLKRLAGGSGHNFAMSQSIILSPYTQWDPSR